MSVSTQKVVPAKKFLKERCKTEICVKFGHKCGEITEEERKNILEDIYKSGNLQIQREFIVRYVTKQEKKKCTVKGESRRNFTINYKLPKLDSQVSVCKKLFINTLGISEKMIRTALEKKKHTGMLESEKRGGRVQVLREKDETLRAAILSHINRFPRMESHYCRLSTSKEYLHPDLTISKMNRMFNNEFRTEGLKSSFLRTETSLKNVTWQSTMQRKTNAVYALCTEPVIQRKKKARTTLQETHSRKTSRVRMEKLV